MIRRLGFKNPGHLRNLCHLRFRQFMLSRHPYLQFLQKLSCIKSIPDQRYLFFQSNCILCQHGTNIKILIEEYALKGKSVRNVPGTGGQPGYILLALVEKSRLTEIAPTAKLNALENTYLNRQGRKVISVPTDGAIVNLHCASFQVSVNRFTFKDSDLKRIRWMDF